MRVLFIDCFGDSRASRRRAGRVRALLARTLQTVGEARESGGAPDLRVLALADIGSLTVDSSMIGGGADASVARAFDRVDVVFADGDSDEPPWAPQLRALAVFIRSCFECDKWLFASGPAAVVAAHVCAASAKPLEVLNGPGGRGSPLADLPHVQPPSGSRVAGAPEPVFLDSDSGDFFAFDPETSSWVPAGNVGVRSYASGAASSAHTAASASATAARAFGVAKPRSSARTRPRDDVRPAPLANVKLGEEVIALRAHALPHKAFAGLRAREHKTRIDCRWVVDEAANVRSKRRLTILGDAASSRGPACFELGASCATLFHLYDEYPLVPAMCLNFLSSAYLVVVDGGHLGCSCHDHLSQRAIAAGRGVAEAKPAGTPRAQPAPPLPKGVAEQAERDRKRSAAGRSTRLAAAATKAATSPAAMAKFGKIFERCIQAGESTAYAASPRVAGYTVANGRSPRPGYTASPRPPLGKSPRPPPGVASGGRGGQENVAAVNGAMRAWGTPRGEGGDDAAAAAAAHGESPSPRSGSGAAAGRVLRARQHRLRAIGNKLGLDMSMLEVFGGGGAMSARDAASGTAGGFAGSGLDTSRSLPGDAPMVLVADQFDEERAARDAAARAAAATGGSASDNGSSDDETSSADGQLDDLADAGIYIRRDGTADLDANPELAKTGAMSADARLASEKGLSGVVRSSAPPGGTGPFCAWDKYERLRRKENAKWEGHFITNKEAIARPGIVSDGQLYETPWEREMREHQISKREWMDPSKNFVRHGGGATALIPLRVPGGVAASGPYKGRQDGIVRPLDETSEARLRRERWMPIADRQTSHPE